MSASLWKQLSTAALLGVGREAPATALPPGLNELLPGDEAGPAERLLRTAAVAGLAQAAGYAPGGVEGPLPEPCPPDALPPCAHPQLVAALVQMADEGPEPLLMETCQLLTAARQTLPHRLIPRFLEAARRSVALRDSILAATGTRGAWLAEQNSDWKFAATAGTEDTDPRLWEEGDSSARARYLRELRKSEPARARELLETTFPKETARDRVVLLAPVSEGLGSADEPFLEGLLLNDRSKEVRTLAGRMLSALPGSAFALRMISRVVPCVVSEKKLFRSHWVVAPPQTFPADAAKDGIEEKPPAGVRQGERAWWLRQITARTPLPWWVQHTGMTPKELFFWAAKSEWQEALLSGFGEAITLQPADPAWVHALLDADALAPQASWDLIPRLSEGERPAAWLRIASTRSSFSWWIKSVLKERFTWTLRFWQEVEKLLVAHLQTDAAQYDYELRALLPELACRMPEERWSTPFPWPTSAKAWSVFEEAASRFQQVVETRSKLRTLISAKL